jgi:hypothetical protein
MDLNGQHKRRKKMHFEIHEKKKKEETNLFCGTGRYEIQ